MTIKLNKYTAVVTIGIVVLVVGSIWFVSTKPRKEKGLQSFATQSLQGAQIPILAATHVPDGTKVDDYNSNPPTSGKHYSTPADWGSYTTSLPDEVVVHNLEHGGIWISYRTIDDKTKAKLKSIASRFNQAVVLSPRPGNDTNIALASWGRLDTLDTFDKARIEEFITANINNSPEEFASLEKVTVLPDTVPPAAAFTTLAGEQRTLSEFQGKKVMFWFLATWCPSCIAGAEVLSESNDQLGNLTIIALETFGNAGFPGPTMEEFAQKNAPDMRTASNWVWGTAPRDASETYNPRNFPDIFFLIDEEGIVRDVDGAPAATINKIIDFANE